MATSKTSDESDVERKPEYRRIPNVLILKGFPASGKTTRAKEIVDKYPNRTVRVNKDDLRAVLYNSNYSKPNEHLVLRIRDKIILEAIKAGRNVIVDDTNLNPMHEKNIRKLVYGLATVTVEFMNVSLEECLRRNKERTDLLANGDPHTVPQDAIESMYKQWVRHWSKVKIEEVEIDLSLYTPDEAKPWAIICDIDGTLAHMGDRGPFTWNKVHLDTVDTMIRQTLMLFEENGYQIILLSGRDSVCRGLTEKWLSDNKVSYSDLFMRPEKDGRKDSIVKYEFMVNNIIPNYFPALCLDDRDQVVSLWRSLGIPTWQVAEGDF